jgi:hypothetical protein
MPAVQTVPVPNCAEAGVLHPNTAHVGVDTVHHDMLPVMEVDGDIPVLDVYHQRCWDRFPAEG